MALARFHKAANHQASRQPSILTALHALTFRSSRLEYLLFFNLNCILQTFLPRRDPPQLNTYSGGTATDGKFLRTPQPTINQYVKLILWNVGTFLLAWSCL
jgi:hypothetical protein